MIDTLKKAMDVQPAGPEPDGELFQPYSENIPFLVSINATAPFSNTCLAIASFESERTALLDQFDQYITCIIDTLQVRFF
jgi:hypothetical protein